MWLILLDQVTYMETKTKWWLSDFIAILYSQIGVVLPSATPLLCIGIIRKYLSLYLVRRVSIIYSGAVQHCTVFVTKWCLFVCLFFYMILWYPPFIEINCRLCRDCDCTINMSSFLFLFVCNDMYKNFLLDSLVCWQSGRTELYALSQMMIIQIY